MSVEVVGLGAARREGRVMGSLGEEESGEAPVRCWTTARKLEGSAWTKVVLLVAEELSWAVEVGEARLEAMGNWKLKTSNGRLHLKRSKREREREEKI